MRNLLHINKGFALSELMIVIAIMGILSLVAIPAIQGKKPGDVNHTESDGTKCVAGYKFYRDRQVVDKNGGGVPCDSMPSMPVPQPLK